ncbi:MAG TPA: ABC transporter permease [Anaerolineales bacterium]|nr:ABC transporter permease [Anaerolineales bacterium]
MWKYILRRIVQVIITLFIYLFITYFLLDAQPGDITLQYMNPRFTEVQRAALSTRLGLDRPVTERFFIWIGNILQGELGDSFSESKPVIDIIKERAPRTIFLFLTAALTTFGVGYYLGRLLAWKRGTKTEYVITVFGAVMYSIFLPWFALLMVLLFGYHLKWLPLGKFLDPIVWRNLPKEISANIIFSRLMITAVLVLLVLLGVSLLVRKFSPNHAGRVIPAVAFVVVVLALLVWITYPYAYLAGDILRHLILPVLTLTLVNFSGTMLLTRTTMLETLREDYIMAARAKGLSEAVVRDKHGARNAMLPVFSNFIIGLPFIVAGGIITETVFSWPGMGLTLLQAATTSDIPLIMGTWVFIGLLSLTAHLVADIGYVFIDPRIRYT